MMVFVSEIIQAFVFSLLAAVFIVFKSAGATQFESSFPFGVQDFRKPKFVTATRETVVRSGSFWDACGFAATSRARAIVVTGLILA